MFKIEQASILAGLAYAAVSSQSNLTSHSTLSHSVTF